MTKFIKEVERRAGVRFATVRPTGGGHYRATVAGLGGHVVLPASPSCHRAAANAAAHIKRKMKSPQPGRSPGNY